MLKPLKRSNEDIEQLEKEVEELQKERNQKNSADFDVEKKEAEDAQKDETLPEEERTWAKRYADTKSWAQKEINKLKKQHQESLDQYEQLKATTPTSLPKTAEELKAWKEEYPEVSDAIEMIASEIADQKAESLSAKVAALEEKNTEASVELVKAKVKKVHKDFDQLADDPAFHEWVTTKASWVGEALYGGTDAQAAIDALNLYKAEKNLLKKEDEPEKRKRGRPRKEEADAAKMVADSSADSPSGSEKSKYLLESEIVKWTDEEFVKNYDMYLDHKRAGTIMYDISGKDK